MSVDPHCRIRKIKPRGNVQLFPGTVAPELPARKQPNEIVIDMLETLLDRARRGDVQGLAAAWINGDGSTASNWAGGQQYGCSLLLGALGMLETEYAETALAARSQPIWPKDPA